MQTTPDPYQDSLGSHSQLCIRVAQHGCDHDLQIDTIQLLGVGLLAKLENTSRGN
jgi:hypothetical protein